MIKNCLFALFVFLLISCGDTAKNEAPKDALVSPTSTTIGGALSEYMKITNGSYAVAVEDEKLVLTIPVELIKPFENEELLAQAKEKTNVLNLSLTLLDANGAPLSSINSFTTLYDGGRELAGSLSTGSGQIYLRFLQYRDYPNSDLQEIRSKAVKFSINSSLNFKETSNTEDPMKEEGTASSTLSSNSNTSSASSSCEKWLNDYDSWVTNYISFMRKYKKNPADASMLSDYSRLTSEMSKWSKGNSGCNDAASVARITQIANRMNRELASL